MSPLEVRPLGDTGLHTSPIGLGLAALGRPAYTTPGRDRDFPEGRSVQQMAMRTFAMLDVAWEAGVRTFDAARSYGQAEGFLSDWLHRRDVEPGDALISSKWGYTYVGDWKLDAPVHEVKHHDLQTFDRQWEATRKVMWSHLDLYQVHSITPDSPALTDPVLQTRLAAVKETHGVRIGATVTGPEQAEAVRRLMEVQVDGFRLFDTVQATWNLLEPSVAEALAEARREGMGVIVKEAFANGRLIPGAEESQPNLQPLAELAGEQGVSLDAFAMAAALTRPWVDTVLTGAVTRQQLESNLAALDMDWDARCEAWVMRIAEEPPAYWRTRSERPWT